MSSSSEAIGPLNRRPCFDPARFITEPKLSGPRLRGFRNRRDAHAVAGSDVGGLVVLTTRCRGAGRDLVIRADVLLALSLRQRTGPELEAVA